MEIIRQYLYSYNRRQKLYYVRIVNEDYLECIPDDLFRKMLFEEVMRTNENICVPDISKCIGFSTNGTHAIVDLYGRNYTQEYVDVLCNSEFANIGIKDFPKNSILSLFKRKKRI